MKPSDEQIEAILYPGNLAITAKPGSGKTFTIVEKIYCISLSQQQHQGIIAISFTNKASDELKNRCIRRGVISNNSFFGTIDSFCIGTIIIPFMKHLVHVTGDAEIVQLCDYPEYGALGEFRADSPPEIEQVFIKSLNNGLIFLDITGESALYIFEKVKQCRDFLKARYSHVFIDEYQDCGEMQHALFVELTKLGIIGIAVGDLDQAIFGFADKHSKYLLTVSKSKSFKHIPITKNYRCHKSISSYSLQLLGIDSESYSKEETRVFEARVEGGEAEIAVAIEDRLHPIMGKYEVTNQNEVAVLFRGNSTLNSFAANLTVPYRISNPTRLEEQGSSQARFFSDLLMSYYSSKEYAGSFIERYIREEENEKRYRKALALAELLFSYPEQELCKKADQMIDLLKMVSLRDDCSPVIKLLNSELKDYSLLERNYGSAEVGEINLMTLHKSKGLEFDVVFHLDAYRFIMPPYKQEDPSFEEYTQLLNLHYVGITRARKVCYIIQGSVRTNSKGEQKDAEPSLFLSINNLEKYRNRIKWQ